MPPALFDYGLVESTAGSFEAVVPTAGNSLPERQSPGRLRTGSSPSKTSMHRYASGSRIGAPRPTAWSVEVSVYVHPDYRPKARVVRSICGSSKDLGSKALQRLCRHYFPPRGQQTHSPRVGFEFIGVFKPWAQVRHVARWYRGCRRVLQTRHVGGSVHGTRGTPRLPRARCSLRRSHN